MAAIDVSYKLTLEARGGRMNPISAYFSIMDHLEPQFTYDGRGAALFSLVKSAFALHIQGSCWDIIPVPSGACVIPTKAHYRWQSNFSRD